MGALRYVIPAESIIRAAFTALATLLLCNINGVIFLIAGAEAPLSPLILLLSCLIVVLALFQLKWTFSSTALSLFMIFFVAYLTVGLLLLLYDAGELHPGTSVYDTVRYYVPSLFILAATYFGARAYLQTGRSRQLLRLLIILATFTASFTILGPMIGLTEQYSFANTNSGESERQIGLFANPNEAGAFGVYLLVLLLAGYGFFRRYYLLCLAVIPLAIYSTFITFSRASIIFTIFVLLLYVVYGLKNFFALRPIRPRRSLIISAIFISGAVFVAVNFFSYVNSLTYAQRTRLYQTARLFSGEFNTKTTSERSILFEYAFERIAERPFTGYGLGTFHRINFRGAYNDIGVHNTHLLILGETGVFIYFLFFAAFALLAWKGWIHPQRDLGFLILGIAAIYFINVAGSGHNALNNRPSNVLVGIICALAQYRPKLA